MWHEEGDKKETICRDKINLLTQVKLALGHAKNICLNEKLSSQKSVLTNWVHTFSYRLCFYSVTNFSSAK